MAKYCPACLWLLTLRIKKKKSMCTACNVMLNMSHRAHSLGFPLQAPAIYYNGQLPPLPTCATKLLLFAFCSTTRSLAYINILGNATHFAFCKRSLDKKLLSETDRSWQLFPGIWQANKASTFVQVLSAAPLLQMPTNCPQCLASLPFKIQ